MERDQRRPVPWCEIAESALVLDALLAGASARTDRLVLRAGADLRIGANCRPYSCRRARRVLYTQHSSSESCCNTAKGVDHEIAANVANTYRRLVCDLADTIRWIFCSSLQITCDQLDDVRQG